MQRIFDVQVRFSIIFFDWKMESQRQADGLNALRKDTFLASHYNIVQMLGAGCFGKIVKAVNKRTGQMMALKIEKQRKSKLKMVLKNEIEIMTKLQGKQGIPQIYASGQWENGAYLELELLDHDLNKGYQYCSSQIIDLTLEVLKIIEGIHSCNIVHQDLKPHNIMKNKEGNLFIIDFGLSKQVPLRNKIRPSLKGFIGTPRYASVQAHNMLEQGKRDDLESLFYNLAYLYYHRLPWSKLTVPDDQRLEKIKLLKLKHRSSLFSQMPPQFQRAFDYITSLHSFQEPDYQQLKHYFKRNKTVVIDRPFGKPDQRNTKRMSLNPSNFLQVPQPDFLKERPKKGDKASPRRGEQNGIARSHSSTSISVFSEAIQSHLLILAQQNEQNFNEDENIEPQLPVSIKINSLVFKNPFA